MTIYTKTYNELRYLQTLEERFEYLSLPGHVGQSTFGFERYLNQAFYTSREWRTARRDAVARDNGCDLGIEGFEIHERVIVHHINPLTEQDIQEASYKLFDLNNLITTSHRTHNAIHYGDRKLLPQPFVERRPGDTALWKRGVSRAY